MVLGIISMGLFGVVVWSMSYVFKNIDSDPRNNKKEFYGR